MTFGPQHYVPVLKVKRGEKAALRAISAVVRPWITPLLEVVVRRVDKATLDDHLDTGFSGLARSVRPYARCFLDTRELADDDPDAAEKVFRRARTEGMVFTPVTGISRVADITAALDHRTDGIAVRLTREEFEHGGLTRRISSFLGHHGLTPEQVDLIVDLGAVDKLIADGIAALTAAFLAEVPHHANWRTLTVSGCAFPAGLSSVDRNGDALIERAEWIAWRDGLHARRVSLPRLPTFSDCAIQHPKGVEGFDPKTMQASATVRYAVSGSWLIIKGEGTKKKLASLQFPGLATQLVSGPLCANFAGARHCEGCGGIKAAAGGAPRLGSLEVWRRLGTIHHVTAVIDGLAALPWP